MIATDAALRWCEKAYCSYKNIGRVARNLRQGVRTVVLRLPPFPSLFLPFLFPPPPFVPLPPFSP